jgi:chromosome condensin MukBEF ATPase and DNA-binding subunit MukB
LRRLKLAMRLRRLILRYMKPVCDSSPFYLPQTNRIADTRLADRVAELSEKQSTGAFPENAAEQTQPSVAGKRGSKSTSPAPPESLSQLRQDLTRAQQDRGELQTRLDIVTKELETLKAKSKVDTRRISQLSAGVTQMTVRLRDREEELRGKAKLVEDVQDEMVTLNLQLNIAEEQKEMLKKENKELVDRWMARKAKEADAMNDESKFG